MVVFDPVKTPCVGICSTGIGDSVCRGCKRFSHEVIHWNAYSEGQRRIIAQRLEGYLTQLVENRFTIQDEALLLAQIQHQQIEFKAEQSPYCWIFDLLRAGASQIYDLSHFGIALRDGWRNLPLTQIRDDIDKDFYALSCAYYERYIAPGLARAGSP
ncbi:DUF1289 domain-containing protein [Gilvimarinus sp. SDUM040013]|uniref:DUF1289 domain-containing protein n=1 Tax=Gilvimarinus gilvus TaxID=3058038 RepID=A0ABU4RUM8_9GAMM|nr:DUF1289 domain-containing protein [Gilvimarinus sp. SDUM040013]MDO3384999.1 DUF1289 domain-containing protein [Gilvimarinus sp. SDUM040013]MDX6848374.1 DUF1289 domain-containing protein [Gilvimarinus sp. SDUM040013]